LTLRRTACGRSLPLQGYWQIPLAARNSTPPARKRTMNHPILAFFNLGGQEMLIIFLIVLLLFGAKKLPELARGLGKSMGEFKRAREDFEREITTAETEVRIKEPAGKESRDG
jgi:sec-independent protein translocase protein TatA